VIGAVIVIGGTIYLGYRYGPRAVAGVLSACAAAAAAAWNALPDAPTAPKRRKRYGKKRKNHRGSGKDPIYREMRQEAHREKEEYDQQCAYDAYLERHGNRFAKDCQY
jgi:hypothetical protein